MQYRLLGRTGIRVSAVGFGTCQLRLVSRRQALATLRRGFELGVNVVHTAPDYEGADALVVEAVEESGREIIVMSQGYGDPAHFEWLFESTCRRLKKQSLEIYGIACIDDREYLGENVWGRGGMVQFLLRKKQEGRLGAIFCTTHGKPEYIAGLVQSGVFDAIMLSYNALGFHLLSYNPAGARELESLPGNLEKVFPLAALHGVGLMIMKPLAGGLLISGKAFPPRSPLFSGSRKLTAAEALRGILRHPEVTCVVPGTASPEEAEENATAGAEPLELSSSTLDKIDLAVAEGKRTLCSRCGVCDTTCSRRLPVSWLFRDTYINNHPSETFETIDALRYFHLHPGETATCSVCDDITCACPVGIEIPKSLVDIHGQMRAWRDEGILPVTPAQFPQELRNGPFPLRVIRREIPLSLGSGEVGTGLFWIENAGRTAWREGTRTPDSAAMALSIMESGETRTQVPLRHDVEPGTRTHVVFEIGGHGRCGYYNYSFFLAPLNARSCHEEGTEIHRHELRVRTSSTVTTHG
jgi:predicted aldo/keto reductase-like oxidoreductase